MINDDYRSLLIISKHYESLLVFISSRPVSISGAGTFTLTDTQREAVDARQRRLYRSVAMVHAREFDTARSYMHRAKRMQS